MSRFALVNGRVLTDHGIEAGLAVVVEEGRITAVLAQEEAMRQAPRVHDLQGAILLPDGEKAA